MAFKFFSSGQIKDFFGKVGDFLGFGSGSSSHSGLSSVWDKFKNGNTNIYNQENVEKTNATNKAIADENLAFQRENLDYQKALQQQIFQREDSANQRAVADMRAAGLSPLAGLQPSSAGEAISTSPLHNDYQEQSYTPQNMGSISDFLGTVSQLRAAFNSNKLQEEQVQSAKLDNFLKANTMLGSIDSAYMDAIMKRYDALDKREQHVYNSYYGITNNMNEYEKIARIVGTQLGFFEPQGTGKDFRFGFENLNNAFSDFVNYSSPTRVPKEAFDNIKDFFGKLSDLAVGNSKSSFSFGDWYDSIFEDKSDESKKASRDKSFKQFHNRK